MALLFCVMLESNNDQCYYNFWMPTNHGIMNWLRWSFLCWLRCGDPCGRSGKKESWPTCIATPHPPTHTHAWVDDWGLRSVKKKGTMVVLVSQWFSPVALLKFDWHFSRDREGQAERCFTFDLVPLVLLRQSGCQASDKKHLWERISPISHLKFE